MNKEKNTQSKNDSLRLTKERFKDIQGIALNIVLVFAGSMSLIVFFWIVVVVVKLIIGE